MSSNLLVLTDKRVQGSFRFDEEDLVETARGLIEACRLLIDNLDVGPEDAGT